MLSDKYKAAINLFDKQGEELPKKSEKNLFNSTNRSKNGSNERDTSRNGGFQYI